ncbi:MAG TPA: hypothetical protein VHO90_21345 [Bacteroidales bacterium]|nr:hypothetical protein [Bacteroidales bacterium]
MKKVFSFTVLIFFAVRVAYSQGELDEQKKIFYRNERSLAILLNSNGIGLNGRYSKRVDAFRKTVYDVEIVSLKHPKEYKRLSQFNPSSRGYVLGKQYNVYVIRAGYGQQKEIFQKFDIGGVAIRRFYTFGPSLALLKPIYYEINLPNTQEVIEEKFNIDHADYILGKASYFKGFGEIKPRPGVFAKAGISFEFSRYDQVIHAIEGGAIAEAFPTKLPIMATKQNYQFFLTLFVSYRFGKVIDPLNPDQKMPDASEFNY